MSINASFIRKTYIIYSMSTVNWYGDMPSFEGIIIWVLYFYPGRFMFLNPPWIEYH